MIYYIRQVKLTRLTLVAILITIVPFTLIILNAKYEIINKDHIILPIFFFACPIITFIFLFYWNDNVLKIEMQYDYIKINGKEVKWNQIVNYKIIDDSYEFKVLKINTIQKNNFKICHRTKYELNDDFEKFIFNFEKKIDEYNNLENENYIKKLPLFYETKHGKIYGLFLISLFIAWTVLFFIKGFSLIHFMKYLFFTFAAIPLLIRIFKK